MGLTVPFSYMYIKYFYQIHFHTYLTLQLELIPIVILMDCPFVGFGL